MVGSRIICVKGKYYDTGTANKSFLQLAMDLKVLGVKEWYFPLEIKDPGVIKINPYAEDEHGETTLTKDQISRVTIECMHNLWYYLREIARIPASGYERGIPYGANRGNIAQAWCLLHGIDSWLCLPRQQGKTKSALAAQNWAYSFGTTRSTFIFINKEGEDTKNNLRDFISMVDYLPTYLRYEYIITEEGKLEKHSKSATRVEHPVTHNRIVVKPKALSYDKAISIGRGLSAPIIHYDEVEFTPYIDVIVENSASTFKKSAQASKEVGAMYGRIFTSTPGDLDTDPGKRSQKLLKKTAQWTDDMYNKTPDELRKIAEADGRMGVFYIEYSYRQIGLTDEWFRETAAATANPLTVRRELLLQRLRGSSLSPYDRDDIDRIIELAKKPIKTILLNKYYRLDIYEELNRNIPYLVGIDCSTGTTKDNNAMSIINPYTTKLVAEFKCSYVGEPEYISCITELVTKYIPRAILCIEKNSVGSAIVAFLLKSRIAGRVYYDKFEKIAEESFKEMENPAESVLKKKAAEKSHYGVWTGEKSRDIMFKILADRIKNYKEEFVGQNVTDDITKLIQKGTKIQAMEGEHDDSVMSYLIALYVYYYGNNLEIFGFSKADVIHYEGDFNSGLRPEEIDLETVPESVVEDIEAQIRRSKKPSFENQYRAALMKEQQKTRVLHNKGLIENDLLDNTISNSDPTDYFEDYGSQDLSGFDDLNGMGIDAYISLPGGDDVFGVF